MDAIRMGKRSGRGFAMAGLVAFLGALAAPVGASAAPPETSVTDPAPQVQQRGPQVNRTGPGFTVHYDFRNNQQHTDVNVCSSAVGPMQAQCHARVRTDSQALNARPARAGYAQPADVIGNSGAYDPGYLQSAYNVMNLINSGAGRGQVVAIVDAFDDPMASADLTSYRSFFGLPALPDCTSWPSATQCFLKTNQSGVQGAYPAADSGWSQEIALDLDMVSAICPSCSIVLVEANSASVTDLAASVNQAVALGANVVSNSYGTAEFSGETGLDSAYQHAGIAITVSSGDTGYGTQWPAASPYVTAVGGTSLNQLTNTGTRSATESAWSGAGSGCSTYEGKPGWQTDPGCTRRTVADVSAVADPNTGVWIYDTYGDGGWAIIGGTSAAAPIVGSIYALAGNSGSSTDMNSDPYSHKSALFDATAGSNGSCAQIYLCTGVVGYDGPTGLGTPNGTAAFANIVAPAPDFSLSASAGSVTLTRGAASVSDTLTLSAANGYHSSVRLTISGLPSGVTASFSPNSVTPTGTSRLTLKANSSARIGTSTLTVTATGAEGTVHSRTISVTVVR